MSAKLNEIWDLIVDLNPDERKILYRRLNEDIKFNMISIIDKVNERVEGDEISFEDITKEVELVRGNNDGEA